MPGLFAQKAGEFRIRPAVSAPPRLGVEEIREALPEDLRQDVTLVVLGQALARHPLVERAGRQANRTMYQARPGT